MKREAFNIWTNIIIGILGVVYILSTWYFRLIVAILRRPGRSFEAAERYADDAKILFTFLILIALLIAFVGIISLFSNMIHFDYPRFFVRIGLDLIVIFMPFVYGESSVFLLYELLFAAIFALYLNHLYVNQKFKDL
ncbi:hypothetical protein [Ligilactobacillus ruminis]|uniref:Uncharacterized protein n=3 Tax=Ligilactobacillus ruminis TaxID=1623 RepID=A0A837ITI5_9LACO|nr:hypothetical protein [Ligilactobacillus ruminis]AEN78229.1 hypothetical membrane protein [Ligilactobacillus ruminis ATCC 27782]KLA46306.1 hypothetical protein LRB_863 [Ligilactobacillus ruminis]MCF2544005.1 hypothetical protein [Ligilactobacillus ruminis]MCR5749488.1 hypothetical protein [Lactobacillus sp.]